MSRHFVLVAVLYTLVFQLSVGTSSLPVNETSKIKGKPNIILFLLDDTGWGDFQSYGHPSQEATFIDELASKGARFTQMYSAASVCTPSRGALLTGKLPARLGLYDSEELTGGRTVFLPFASSGLAREESTIAEVLKTRGYATGMVGKWHLGINKYNHSDGYYLPTHQGFDYVGTLIPFSLASDCGQTAQSLPSTRLCFLYNNTTIVQQPIDLNSLTPRLVADTKAFLYDHQNKPFFFFLSFPQTHTPMFNMEEFAGKSIRGKYGDSVLEAAWAIESVMATVRELGLEDDTLVIITSDHGPALEECQNGGSPGPFSGGKMTYMEGGIRVPAIFYWPGVIKPRTEHSVASLLDILPTLAELAGASIPRHVTTDGVSILDTLLSHSTVPLYESHEFLPFLCGIKVMSVRYRQYKVTYRMLPGIALSEIAKTCPQSLHDATWKRALCTHVIELDHPAVFNIEEDPAEHLPLKGEIADRVVAKVSTWLSVWYSNFHSKPALFSDELASKSLFPCCNPPYCVCR